MPSLNLHAEILALKVMVSGGRAFGRWLGHVGGNFINAINVLTTGTPQSSPALSLPCEDT